MDQRQCGQNVRGELKSSSHCRFLLEAAICCHHSLNITANKDKLRDTSFVQIFPCGCYPLNWISVSFSQLPCSVIRQCAVSPSLARELFLSSLKRLGRSPACHPPKRSCDHVSLFLMKKWQLGRSWDDSCLSILDRSSAVSGSQSSHRGVVPQQRSMSNGLQGNTSFPTCVSLTDAQKWWKFYSTEQNNDLQDFIYFRWRSPTYFPVKAVLFFPWLPKIWPWDLGFSCEMLHPFQWEGTFVPTSQLSKD